MEHLGGGNPVDIRMHPVGIDQLLVLGHMGKDAQLNLGIVRICKKIPFPGYKHFPDLSPQFHPHGDILQVRVRGADTPGSCYGLVKGRVDPLVLPDKGRQPLRIGGF